MIIINIMLLVSNYSPLRSWSDVLTWCRGDLPLASPFLLYLVLLDILSWGSWLCGGISIRHKAWLGLNLDRWAVLMCYSWTEVIVVCYVFRRSVVLTQITFIRLKPSYHFMLLYFAQNLWVVLICWIVQYHDIAFDVSMSRSWSLLKSKKSDWSCKIWTFIFLTYRLHWVHSWPFT